MSTGYTRYFVIRESTCPDCEGEGIRINPEWVGANEAWDQAQNEVLNQGEGEGEDERLVIYIKSVDAAVAALREYWRDLGYNPDSPPPDEERCDYCDGSGVVRDEIELAEALQAVVNPF